MQDAIAELTERAHEISQEAGTKVSLAMRDVISAAAGLAGFAIESARDLVQYMVRRGQMTPEEGEKLIRQAEEAHAKRPSSERDRPTASKVAAEKAAAKKAADAVAKAEANAAFRAAKAKPAPAAKKEASASPPKKAGAAARKESPAKAKKTVAKKGKR
jgi:polyhydroxyalkanoate synthesis regulator phasin